MRQALLNACTQLATPDRGPTLREMAAVACVGLQAARRTVENAMRGYKEINYRAMKLLPRGGYLATASCSHFATEEDRKSVV